MGEIAYQNKDVASKVTGEALVGKSLAPFGLAHLKIVGILPTNLPAIETNELRLDNLFLLSDGSVAIIDYESAFSRENFIKYINYIARVMKRYAASKRLAELKKLKMIVIYTADVEQAEEIYDLGGFFLKVEAAYLIQMDSDLIYRRISEKIGQGKALSEEEFLELMLLPLTVKGKTGKKKMVVKAVELAQRLPDNERTMQALAGILTFSDKIVDEEYGRRIKEIMAMTLVERLIFEDGWNAGKKEGKEEGKIEGRIEGRREGREEGEREAHKEIKRYSGLTLSLLSEKKYKDLEKASKNAEYRKKLYRKYGL